MGINLPAILIADTMGIAIVFSVAVGNHWRAKSRSVENRMVVIMILSSLISCIFESVCSLADGKEGFLNYMLVMTGNTWLFIGNMIIGVCWVILVTSHLGIRLDRFNRIAIKVLCSFGLIMLAVNFFAPVVFSVDENNTYERTPFIWYYIALLLFFVLDGVVIYYHTRKQSGNLKYFPVWAFVIPGIVGMLIQISFYGVTTITPFITVSVSCITTCLQNEFLFIDRLTGLYNRFYLNSLERVISKNRSGEYTAMMLDINRFKAINDTYGHKMGDKALIDLARILKKVIGETGSVIRYAGDEFIIILNSKAYKDTSKMVSDIYSELNYFNKVSSAPYKLSVAIGYSRLDFKRSSMDEFLDSVDKLMYEDKRRHYCEVKKD